MTSDDNHGFPANQHYSSDSIMTKAKNPTGILPPHLWQPDDTRF